VTDERTCPRSRDVDRHEREIDQIHEHYVRKDVYQAALDRLTALESKLSNTWLSNRNALLAVGSVIVGIIWSAYTKGGH
jgi:hypothetical protein